MSEIYQQLAESFPPEMVRRLNKIIGVENWSFTVKSWQQLGTSIVAHVSVQATIEGKTITREGVGGQKIKMSKQGDPVDIGDEVKGAVSDALKKAVQTLGIGLYLARSEEAMEIEQAIDASVSAPPAPPAPVVSPKYEQFKSLLDASEDNKAKIKTFWSNYGGGRPVPKPSEFTDEELDTLITELVSYSFAGSTLVEAPAKKKEKAPDMPPRRDID